MAYRKRSTKPRKYKKKRTTRTPQKKAYAAGSSIQTTHGSRPTIVRMPGYGQFPDIMLMKHQYSDILTLAATSGVINKYTFQSSMYDPDLTGTGGQPMGRDAVASIYEEYRVTGISYEILALNLSTTIPARMCITASDSDYSWSTFEQAQQQPITSKTAILGVAGSSGSQCRFKGYVSVAKAVGVKQSAIYNEDNYKATTNTSPTDMAYLSILHNNMTNDTSTTDIHCQVRLVYYCRWENRQEMSES